MNTISVKDEVHNTEPRRTRCSDIQLRCACWLTVTLVALPSIPCYACFCESTPAPPPGCTFSLLSYSNSHRAGLTIFILILPSEPNTSGPPSPSDHRHDTMTGTKRTMILDNTRNPSSRAASTATRSLLDLGEDIIALIMEELQAVSPHSVSSLALVHSSCA